MNKKQNLQSVEIKQQGSSISTRAELTESSISQFSLPTADTEEEECTQCKGIGVVSSGGIDVPCPRCSNPQQPVIAANAVETPAMALACATVGTAAGVGQVTAPTPISNSGQPSGFGGAEAPCPNCRGKRYFTEEVMNDEGKPITATIACGRCNGLGYLIIPLYSPVLAQEKVMASKWPTEPVEINWPWVGEPDPVIGTIVGWNWETEEVAVITKQPQYLNMKPWKVTIGLQPMPKNLFSCIVIGMDEPIVHKEPVWYTTWTRTGEKDLPDGESTTSFFGRCIVQELK